MVSFNTGSDVPLNSFVSAPPENIVPVKPVFNLLQARRLIVPALKQKPMNFIVIGGGPAGVEVTANLWRLVNENRGKATIRLIAGRKLLGGLPEKVRRPGPPVFDRPGHHGHRGKPCEGDDP